MRNSMRKAVFAMLLLSLPGIPAAIAKEPQADPAPAEMPAMLPAFGEELLDATISLPDQTPLGEVEDLVLDAEAGHVSFLVVEAPASNLYLVLPYSVFEVTRDKDIDAEIRIRSKLRADELRVWPAFGEDAWEDADSRETIDRVLMSYRGSYGGLAKSDGRFVRYSELEDFDLENPERQDVGDIEDLVLDAKTGEIRDLIASSGGFLGIGETRHVIPWSRTEVEEDREAVVRKQERGRGPELASSTVPALGEAQ